LLIEHPS